MRGSLEKGLPCPRWLCPPGGRLPLPTPACQQLPALRSEGRELPQDGECGMPSSGLGRHRVREDTPKDPSKLMGNSSGMSRPFC